MNDSAVASLSCALPKTLASLLHTTEDNFTVEKVATQVYRDGEIVDGDPMIEVLWFDRGRDTQDAAAKAITEIAKRHTSSEFIAVVFTALPKTAYYENGTHF